MITPEDNNKDNAYERVKRWREKNRALYNLRQREYRRKKNLPVPVLASSAAGRTPANAAKSRDKIGMQSGGEARESTHPKQAVNAQSDSRGGQNPTIEALRALVKQEQEKPSTEARVRSDVVGGIYRNDSGGVISKFAWEKLQKLKEKAEKGGYTLDEYSQ